MISPLSSHRCFTARTGACMYRGFAMVWSNLQTHLSRGKRLAQSDNLRQCPPTRTASMRFSLACHRSWVYGFTQEQYASGLSSSHAYTSARAKELSLIGISLERVGIENSRSGLRSLRSPLGTRNQ